MSLMKRRTMTERQKDAARTNGRSSHGPATRDGRERIRAANLRHGLFSQAQEIVLPSLGEDAEQFENLTQSGYESWPGADASQVASLAAAMWRLERVDRRLEDLELALVQSLTEGAVDFPCAYSSKASLRALTMEACAFRDFMRISNRLLKASMERDRASTELPEKVLKTKKEGS